MEQKEDCKNRVDKIDTSSAEVKKAELIGFTYKVNYNEDGSGCISIQLIEEEKESVESLMQKLSEQVMFSEKLQKQLEDAETKMAEIDKIKQCHIGYLPSRHVEEFDEFEFLKLRKEQERTIRERQEKIKQYRYCGYSHTMAIQVADFEPSAPVANPKKVTIGAFTEHVKKNKKKVRFAI